MTIREGFFGHDDSRTIAVRRWMIDATRDPDGDVNLWAALMLAQVTFWTDPDTRTGVPRAGHQHGQHWWLVRADDDEAWEQELGISARQVRRTRTRLVQLGLIESRSFVDRGVKCSHLRRLFPDASDPERSDGLTLNGQTDGPRTVESHAGASPSLLGEVGETSPSTDVDEARAIVTAFWEWHRRERGTAPTLASRGKGNAFLALVAIVRNFLDADYPPARIKRALTECRTFTIDSITYALNQQVEHSSTASNPSGNPHFRRYSP